MTHLYVCHFSSGHIKVGRSIDPQSRIAQHADRVDCVGVELIEFRSFACSGNAQAAEAMLIERCTTECVRRLKSEWFEGISFDGACEWASEIAGLAHVPAHPIRAILDKAIELCGGVGKLAAAIGISQSAVSNWRARGTSPEPVNCVAIEQATAGAVTRQDLRPTDWHKIWPELATPSKEAADA